jgi:hypothetical protein
VKKGDVFYLTEAADGSYRLTLPARPFAIRDREYGRRPHGSRLITSTTTMTALGLRALGPEQRRRPTHAFQSKQRPQLGLASAGAHCYFNMRIKVRNPNNEKGRKGCGVQ